MVWKFQVARSGRSPLATDRLSPSHRLFRWTVIEGNRLLVAGTLLGSIFFFLRLLLAVNLFPRAPGEPLYLLLSSFLDGNLTLITVVIAINQLSRELGSPGNLEERTRNAVECRDQVQEVTDQAVSPVLPGSFLLVLHANLDSRAQALGETTGEAAEDGHAFESEVTALVEALRRDVQMVTECSFKRESVDPLQPQLGRVGVA